MRVRRLSLAVGGVNAVAAMLGALTGDPVVLTIGVTLSVFSFCAYMFLVDHDVR